MKEMFLGNFRSISSTYPERTEWRGVHRFLEELRVFLRDEWDELEVDASGEYPETSSKACENGRLRHEDSERVRRSWL